ncbi:Uncharacterised protein [Mycobacterium tuberculosis]|nr:Uncharacterised protein [Mycobacterium tuberculosis]
MRSSWLRLITSDTTVASPTKVASLFESPAART